MQFRGNCACNFESSSHYALGQFVPELHFSPIAIIKHTGYKMPFISPHCSAPSCDRFGRHSEWKKIMATKIITNVAKLASVSSVK